jgi:hypothetical protein
MLFQPSMSGVRVGTWVAATHDDLESVEVEIPALAVVASLVVVWETVVTQGHSGATIGWLERHHHPGTARRNGSVLVPAPAEHDAPGRVDLDELTGCLDTVAHRDPVGPAWNRVEARSRAHPLHVPILAGRGPAAGDLGRTHHRRGSYTRIIQVIVLTGVLSLGIWGGVAGRRAGLSGWALVLSIVSGLFLGGIILVLQALLQPGHEPFRP